jgi:hypothetical protein
VEADLPPFFFENIRVFFAKTFVGIHLFTTFANPNGKNTKENVLLHRITKIKLPV